MVYRVLADAVVVVHFAFIVFVVTGPLLARRWHAVAVFHLAALAWAVGILTVGYECPLTGLENWLRHRAGEPAYPGGFVDHYIENVLYPQRFTPILLALAAVTIALGYAGLLRSARRRRGVGGPVGARARARG